MGNGNWKKQGVRCEFPPHQSAQALTASPPGEAICGNHTLSLPLEGKVAEGRMRWNVVSPASRRNRICAVTPARRSHSMLSPHGFRKGRRPFAGESREGSALSGRGSLRGRSPLRPRGLRNQSAQALTASPRGEAICGNHTLSLPLEGKVAEGRMRWNVVSPASRRARCAAGPLLMCASCVFSERDS